MEGDLPTLLYSDPHMVVKSNRSVHHFTPASKKKMPKNMFIPGE